MNISDCFKKNLIKNFNLEHERDLNDKIKYYKNAKADVIHCFTSIEKYLDKDKKILEVGGYSFAYQFFAPKL